jgi:hypothetical protein
MPRKFFQEIAYSQSVKPNEKKSNNKEVIIESIYGQDWKVKLMGKKPQSPAEALRLSLISSSSETSFRIN